MTSQPKIQIRSEGVWAGRPPQYFTVENAGGAYDFMVSLDRCKPSRLSAGPNRMVKAFEWARLDKFLAFAAAQGVEVVRT